MTKEKIELGNGIYLLRYKGKLAPYTADGPIRGFDKNGKEVWRSYKTAEEAKLNLCDLLI